MLWATKGCVSRAHIPQWISATYAVALCEGVGTLCYLIYVVIVNGQLANQHIFSQLR